MKVSRKARRGRKRKPRPHEDHHNPGATQDPFVRARRAAYRRTRTEETLRLDPSVEDRLP